MKKILIELPLRFTVHWAINYVNATFFFFFIPGDTISCNVSYPGMPGPPGFDGPPGMVNENLLSYTFPRIKDLARQKQIQNPKQIYRQIGRVFLKLL